MSSHSLKYFKPEHKVRHFVRYYPDYEKNPTNFKDLEVETRTAPIVPDSYYTHYQFYDTLVVKTGTKVKTGTPFNFSKLHKL